MLQLIIMSEISLLKHRTVAERFDGSLWRIYDTPNSLVYLTGSGHQLLVNNPNMHHYLKEYILAIENQDSSPESARPFFAKGSQSSVFSLGDKRLLVKEAKPNGEALLPSLERMDRLVDAVQKSCPRWIDVPHQYGALVSKSDISKQFMLVEKIDSGVTVGDVLGVGGLTQRSDTGFLHEGALDSFGTITPELQNEIKNRFLEMSGLLRKALLDNMLSPDIYLPDFDYNPYNVALERLNVPEAGSQIKYWVIDQ